MHFCNLKTIIIQRTGCNHRHQNSSVLCDFAIVIMRLLVRSPLRHCLAVQYVLCLYILLLYRRRYCYMKRPAGAHKPAWPLPHPNMLYIYILCLYSSLQVHQFQSFPVPLSIRALYLPVLFPKKMVNPDNKVQLHHIRLRRCAHNVRTCYAGNAGGIIHLGHEMKAYFWPVNAKGNLLPQHGLQASYAVHQYSTWVKQPIVNWVRPTVKTYDGSATLCRKILRELQCQQSM